MGTTIQNIKNLADWYTTESQSDDSGHSADVSKKSNTEIESVLSLGDISLSTTDENLWYYGSRVKDEQGNYLIFRVSKKNSSYRKDMWQSESEKRQVQAYENLVGTINNWYSFDSDNYFKENGYILDEFKVGNVLPFGVAYLSSEYEKISGIRDNYYTYIPMDNYPNFIKNNSTYNLNNTWGFGNISKGCIVQWAYVNNDTHFGVIYRNKLKDTSSSTYYDSTVTYSVYLIEKTEQIMNWLGTNYHTEKGFIAHSPLYGEGGVAQGLQGIVDTLSDDVNVPLKSTKGATTTGFINAYVIEQDELKDFGKDMFTDIDLDFEWDRTEAKQEFANEYSEIDWTQTAPEVFASASSFLGTFKNFFDLIKASVQNLFTSKLINYVLSVHIIPVNPSTLASAERIDVGWKKFSQTAKRITNDYVDFDYGTLTIPSKYKNFLDYTHTHCKIYIPFTGFVDIDPRYVYDQTLGLKVRFNVLDGTCVSFLTTTGLTGNTSVIGTYSGSCCVHLPFTGENYSQIASGLLQTATSVGGALAMGNFAVGMASAMQPSMQNVAPPTQHMTKATKKNPTPIFYTTQNDIVDYNNRLSNAQSQYQNDLQARESNIANAKFGRDLKTTNALMGNLGSTGNALNGSAMGSANMSSSSAFMGIRTPYIIIERPIPQLPPRYFSDHGGLANIVEKPINCNGYTRCSDVVMPTTIKSEIANKLKEIMESGFIV